MDTELNPYAAPQSELLPDRHDATRERLEHLRTEEHLKACGLLFVGISLINFVSFLSLRKILEREFNVSFETDVPWREIALASLPLVLGFGVYLLKRWAGLLTCIQLITLVLINLKELPANIPGLLVQVLILLFFLSKRVRRVFSRDYQRMIVQTPEMRTRPATWIYPVIVLIVMVLVSFFVRL